ncbi:TNFAIP3-interacting protein 1 isoform X2 [Nerophis ophidion]|uniref:TNFAIP3-interacting protein 1 isoform X2 n=1 Tax=Nerophis ophidion TaxID=159077 RepID=UPI002ADF1292|nr:TNFAIP3-interacting protein 1 isoform X2 [Nerophis ophidion]
MAPLSPPAEAAAHLSLAVTESGVNKGTAVGPSSKASDWRPRWMGKMQEWKQQSSLSYWIILMLSHLGLDLDCFFDADEDQLERGVDSGCVRRKHTTHSSLLGYVGSAMDEGELSSLSTDKHNESSVRRGINHTRGAESSEVLWSNAVCAEGDRSVSELQHVPESMSITCAEQEKLQLLNKNTELRRVNKELMKLNEEWDQTYHSTTLRLQHRMESLELENHSLKELNSKLLFKVENQQCSASSRPDVQDLKEQLEVLRCQNQIYETEYQTEHDKHKHTQQDNRRLRRKREKMRQQVELLQEQLKVYEDDFRRERSDKQILQKMLLKKTLPSKEPVLVHRCNNMLSPLEGDKGRQNAKVVHLAREQHHLLCLKHPDRDND